MKYKKGDTFNQWTLLDYYPDKKRWLAKCSCGLEKFVIITHLVKGNSTKCKYCYGMSKRSGCFFHKREYNSWDSMKQRCFNKNNDRYSNYGGRGITICSDWRDSFEKFFDDMGVRPEGTTLDRIDNEGNYEVSNCKWSTSAEQASNKSTNIQHAGRTYTIKALAELYNMPYGRLQSRIKRGWPLERALTESKCG